MDINRIVPSAAMDWRSYCVAMIAAAGCSSFLPRFTHLESSVFPLLFLFKSFFLLPSSTFADVIAQTAWTSLWVPGRSIHWRLWTRGSATCVSLINPTALWSPERTGAFVFRSYSPTPVPWSLWVIDTFAPSSQWVGSKPPRGSTRGVREDPLYSAPLCDGAPWLETGKCTTFLGVEFQINI